VTAFSLVFSWRSVIRYWFAEPLQFPWLLRFWLVYIIWKQIYKGWISVREICVVHWEQRGEQNSIGVTVVMTFLIICVARWFACVAFTSLDSSPWYVTILSAMYERCFAGPISRCEGNSPEHQGTNSKTVQQQDMYCTEICRPCLSEGVRVPSVKNKTK
jgi:hypothetical protein